MPNPDVLTDILQGVEVLHQAEADPQKREVWREVVGVLRERLRVATNEQEP